MLLSKTINLSFFFHRVASISALHTAKEKGVLKAINFGAKTI